MFEYKVLSIKSPWAQLICIGAKTVENRTWRTNVRGTVLIHNSIGEAIKPWLLKANLTIPQKYAAAEKLSQFYLSFDDMYELGGNIIGMVDIVGCESNQLQYPFASACSVKNGELVENYQFILENPRLFIEPIPCKGKLNFWNYQSKEDLLQRPILTPNKEIVLELKRNFNSQKVFNS